jgi:hypothetical protein
VAVSIDEYGDLLLEWDDADDVVWSSGEIIKQLKNSPPTAATMLCCWRLCRRYDDAQETSAAVTQGVSKKLAVDLSPAFWYWDDQHSVLVTSTSVDSIAVADDPEGIDGIKTKQNGSDVDVALLPGAWLRDLLIGHLIRRAFPEQGAENE